MTKQHNEARTQLRHQHEAQHISQAKEQRAKFAKGIKGLWHRVTGQHLKVTREHECKALKTYQQQRMEMDNLIYTQLEKRQQLEQAFGNFQKVRTVRKQEFERD